MTTRELKITKAVLNYLHLLEGGQAIEAQIHLGANQFVVIPEPTPSLAEIRSVIAELDAKGFIAGIKAKLTGKMKWNITDAGEAVLLELKSLNE